MSAPYRIEKKSTSRLETLDNDPQDPNAGFKDYLSRLLKMIPGEVVGLYMIGSGFIPAGNTLVLTIWSALCLAFLIILRLWGTADPANGKPAQPLPVTISAIAFLIWLYWLGGPFEGYGIHIPYIGSLLVLAWSFIIPVFYKGE